MIISSNTTIDTCLILELTKNTTLMKISTTLRMSPTTTIASELAELTNSLPTKITVYPIDGVGLLLYLIIQERYLIPS